MPDHRSTHITLDDVASVRGARALSEAEMAGIYGGAPATYKEKQGTAIKVDHKVETGLKLDPQVKLNKQSPSDIKRDPPHKQNLK